MKPWATEMSTGGVVVVTVLGVLIASAVVMLMGLVATIPVDFWAEVLVCIATAFAWWPLADRVWQWLNSTPSARPNGYDWPAGMVLVLAGSSASTLLVAGAATDSEVLWWVAAGVLVVACVARTVLYRQRRQPQM